MVGTRRMRRLETERLLSASSRRPLPCMTQFGAIPRTAGRRKPRGTKGKVSPEYLVGSGSGILREGWAFAKSFKDTHVYAHGPFVGYAWLHPQHRPASTCRTEGRMVRERWGRWTYWLEKADWTNEGGLNVSRGSLLGLAIGKIKVHSFINCHFRFALPHYFFHMDNKNLCN